MFRVEKVGVVGEGKMGTSIFHYLLGFDLDLVWLTSTGADTEKLGRQFGKRIRRSFDAGILDRTQYDKRLAFPVTPDPHELQDCDLVIEAIPEDRGLKKDLFDRLDRIVKPGAIFTSNSSSINPSELMPQPEGNRQFAGLHFFYPVVLKDIVEITLSPSTSARTRSLIESFLRSVQRRYITLDEQNSFILNKIFLEFQNEACLMVLDGKCSFSQMDQLTRSRFFPFGVFDFCDTVGLDTMLASVQNYTRHYPDKEKYGMFLSALAGLVSKGKLGVSTGEGFYKYPLDGLQPGEPENGPGIVEKLHQTWLSACKSFAGRASVPPDAMNHAIREYFGPGNDMFE